MLIKRCFGTDFPKHLFCISYHMRCPTNGHETRIAPHSRNPAIYIYRKRHNNFYYDVSRADFCCTKRRSFLAKIVRILPEVFYFIGRTFLWNEKPAAQPVSHFKHGTIRQRFQICSCILQIQCLKYSQRSSFGDPVLKPVCFYRRGFCGCRKPVCGCFGSAGGRQLEG